MTLLEVNANFDRVVTELYGCRIALESIAQSLLRLTEIPAAPPGPDKPLGPEAISSYANMLLAMEGEEADELRARLKAEGLTDEQIENQVINIFQQGITEEEPTL